MATVTVYSAARMKQIEDKAIVNGAVDLAGDLTLYQRDGTAISAGNIKGPKGDTPAIPSATTTVRGGVLLATDAITAAGTDTGRAVTPASLASLKLSRGRYVVSELGANVDLNQITVPGAYKQTQNAEASKSLNYPADKGGLLEVFAEIDGAGGLVWQRYTTLGPESSGGYRARWSRSYNIATSSWSTWWCEFNEQWTEHNSFNTDWRHLANSAYGKFRYRVLGDTVHLNGAIETTIARTGANSYTMTVLPSELWPSKTQQVPTPVLISGVGLTSTVYLASMSLITPAGNLTYYPGNSAITTPANVYVFFNATYPLN